MDSNELDTYTATGIQPKTNIAGNECADEFLALPSNKDIKAKITNVQNAVTENKNDLSAQGQKVMEDTNKLLEATKHLIDKKNHGEFVQEVYTEAYNATYQERLADRRSNLKQIWKSFETSHNGTVAITRCITKFIRLLIASKDFRLLINDLELFMQSAFAVTENFDTEPSTAFIMDAITTTNLTGVNAVSGELGTNSSSYFFGATPKRETLTAPFMPAPDGISSSSDNDSSTIEQDDIENSIAYWLRITKTLAENQDFQESLNFLFNEIRSLSKHTPSESTYQEIQTENEADAQNFHVVVAWLKAKKFLENWISSDCSLDNFLASIQDFAEKSELDAELCHFFGELRNFFFVRVADSNYSNHEEIVKEHARRVIDDGRKLFKEKYRKEFTALLREVQFLNDGLQSDEDINLLQENFQQLVQDAFRDENNHIIIRQELLNDLTLIIPSIVHSLRRLPLPNIDLCNERSDLRIRNGILDCSDISPSNFYFTVQSITEGDSVHNCVHVIVSNIRARILGADFEYNKKTFPKFSESGLLDLAIYGNNGMVISFEVSPRANNHTRLTLENNLCKINKFDVRLRNTSHDVLFAIVSPLINAVVKKRIENLIQQTLEKLVEKVNTTRILMHHN